MNRDLFLKALTKNLYPRLRAEGFRGSGLILRRIQGPVIHVFHFQGSAGYCFLNLGAHLAFLPSGRGPVIPEKIQEYECEFRERYDSPPQAGRGWNYCDNQKDFDGNIEFICDHWDTYATPFYQKYGTFPDSFVPLVNKAAKRPPREHICLTYALIALEIGMKAQAKVLAQAGLDKDPYPEMKKDLRQALKRAEQASARK